MKSHLRVLQKGAVTNLWNVTEILQDYTVSSTAMYELSIQCIHA
jgi:hypothetical protein